MSTTLPFIDFAHKTSINISPNEADLAITSINNFGTPGDLNTYVLKEYGYEEVDLPPSYQLDHGFGVCSDKEKKSILFVVTVNGKENTNKNLERNLFNTLIEFRGWFRGKKLWIPLMGTGTGGLSLEESYKITVNTINRFQKESPTGFIILLSIPQSEEGFKLFELIQFNETLDNSFFRSLNFIEENKINFYLVKSNIENDDNEFWHQENGLSLEILSEIKKNDILISYTTYISNDLTYLRIKSIGIIIENILSDGTIKVDWKIKNILIDIEDIIYIKNTIQEISKDEIMYILSKIKIPYLGDFILYPNRVNTKEKIAGLISDSDDGVDYLEIDKDVNAFAKVIAAKNFEPPLAISLFGKWGSGKSFFMKKLKTKISELSKINSTYCEGVAQIHFNAWSYMDSNLWASIVTRIFEELNIYITNNTNAGNERKLVEEKLTSSLSIAKNEIDNLKNEKEILFDQILKLKKRKRDLVKEIKLNIEKIEKNSILSVIKNVNQQFKADEKIINSIENNESFVKSKEELQKIIPEKYWNDPEKTYELAKSRYIFLKEFFRKDKIFFNIIILTFILVIIGITPLILQLCSDRLKSINFFIPQTTLSILIASGAIWRRGERVYNKLQPLVASFWKIKEEYELKVNEAKAKFEQEEKVIKLKIEKNKSEILLISEQIQKTEILKTDLEFRISNALSTETLYSFIDKRSKSNDYQKHLGIISIIRKDFEILNDLFLGHHKEVNKNNSSEDFKSKFSKPLERIILYIDDLDRCPEENVVQVLEAVNLLMAFPLFVVVVGVDSRWVKNALHKKHFKQFKKSKSAHSEEPIEVSNYLEKIFQIPFHLKDANDNNVKDMIKKLSQNKFEKSLQSVNESLAPALENIFKKNKNSEEEVTIDGNVGNSTDLNESKSNTQPPTNNITKINFSMNVENLILTDIEIEIMQDMSEIIGNNPRCIKRFVNIFRIIKAHEEFGYSDNPSNQDIIVILFLIALPLGKYKKLVPNFEEYITDTDNSNKAFNNYFRSNHVNVKEDILNLKHKVNIILSDKKNYFVLQNVHCNIFKKHNSFIKRFTFSQI
ncbi:P-loop NTPase fold protein [Chryseobacterium gambrini]|uniref:KAP family NTPase n=1 Tax=Chryseobacterium gambrini TaxID=373672 RepID=A0ABM8K345_9FLAO|nr:KAP family NTPase [Chryseobacterium gambrini]